jgi:opacity protein-like surface antigen
MRMNCLGLATAAFAVVAIATPAAAADLGGSMKDRPMLMQAAAGPCYFRGDIGYSWSQDPSARFTQTAGGLFVTDAVSNVSLDNSWVGGVGVGCGSGSRGIRGEIMLDWHGDRDLTGTLAAPLGGTVNTSIQSTTLMFNGYYDLGRWANVVPYIGAGVGVARNRMDDVSFTALGNTLNSEDKWSLAWSLMAGVSYQLSERVIIDLGYRYIDLGKAESSRIDSAGFVNPSFRVDDLTAHEFKVGLRWHFGGGPSYAGPMMK